ncbi:hypothetical protein [Aureivirga marina]|uniref:hypothetical protein n=1 Tax=Aureivirga marina TaxID=1182451 RepID=UPI0018CB740B|nr:hypothetical protein [Aureivirga marina]
MNNIKHLAINWTDGVKINKDHFKNSYFHLIETIKEQNQISLNDYNFGLLAPLNGYNSPLVLKTTSDSTERLTIQLESCHAVTQGGYQILFSRELYGDDLPSITLKNDVSESETSYHILLTIHPFTQIPVGEPDPEVIPLHQPFVLPKITLEAVSAVDFNPKGYKNYYLVIGRVSKRNGVLSFDHSYIPPISQIQHFAITNDLLRTLTMRLVKIKNYALDIYRKNKNKTVNNPLVTNTFLLNHKMLSYISHHLFDFQEMGKNQPPIFLLQKSAILGHELLLELELMSDNDREQLLQYIYEWIDVKPSDLESTLSSVSELSYNHYNLKNILFWIEKFTSLLEVLWRKFSDLEYIGQRKENIVISEDIPVEKKVEKQKRSWSIID